MSTLTSADDYESLQTLLIILLNRIGGAVTITTSEIREVSYNDELEVSFPQSFQDDTMTIRVIRHGS